MKNTYALLPLLLLLFSVPVLCQPTEPTKKGHLEVVAEPGISQMQSKYIEENKNRPGMEGYRVQIYNGTRQETLTKRTEFLSVFPTVAVYTTYEAPEYKVQVGDFRTRLEAEKFLKQVVSEFGSGFVVKTKIKLPPLNTVPNVENK